MRTIFYVSDRTAITAETIGHSLLAQFKGTSYREITVPYVDTPDKALEVLTRINEVANEDGEMPVVFSTIAEPKSRTCIIESNALVLDLFHVFLEPIQHTLNAKPALTTIRSHRISNTTTYETRIDAIDFSLQHDDGAYVKHYEKAELIMIGVSRSGKTPTCLYLAMQFGIRAANYPLTEDDLLIPTLPKVLQPYESRLHGLSIDPRRLESIRRERRPNSPYASLDQCRLEVRSAETLFRSHGIPFVNTTNMSVEEIATMVVQVRGLDRHSLT